MTFLIYDINLHGTYRYCLFVVKFYHVVFTPQLGLNKLRIDSEKIFSITIIINLTGCTLSTGRELNNAQTTGEIKQK